MNKILRWFKNEKKTVRKLICNLPGPYGSRATCTALLQLNARGKRSFRHSELRYPWTDEFTHTTEYQNIIFPWMHGENFDVNNNRIIHIKEDINEDDL